MESNLRKFGEKFYDLNVSITGMCCLGLLDSSNRNAARALDAATKHDPRVTGIPSTKDVL